MKVAVTRKEIESALYDRFGDVFERHERVLPETLATEVVEIDNALGGFPRGAITEITGRRRLAGPACCFRRLRQQLRAKKPAL